LEPPNRGKKKHWGVKGGKKHRVAMHRPAGDEKSKKRRNVVHLSKSARRGEKAEEGAGKELTEDVTHGPTKKNVWGEQKGIRMGGLWGRGGAGYRVRGQPGGGDVYPTNSKRIPKPGSDRARGGNKKGRIDILRGRTAGQSIMVDMQEKRGL